MPLLALRDDRLPDPAALAEALRGLPPEAPVVVMIHGFRYDPDDPGRDPHRHILALAPDGTAWGAVSWPRRLGLGGAGGLGLAWGWEAGGTIWRAHRRAGASAEALAELVGRLRALDPDRPLHVIAHSLGARVAVLALRRLRAHDVQRMILMAPALAAGEAEEAMRSPAGRAAEVINVAGRENRLFDLLLWLAVPLRGRRLRPGAIRAEGWLDLELDRAEVRAGLRRLGWPVAPSRAAVCHWSGYLRPGVWRLYRALLLRPREAPLAHLRRASAAAPPPRDPAPRRLPLGPGPRAPVA